ncbi:replication-relaxation family protein [Alicyclobacillus fodiniaquatilis]|uniref:Replication-relaxation family protein n=1 Tax=Alicyclobacillus fodiniaquatilis TaxID=1661150 RepID=A0ABW4JMM5_9BACL
MDFLRTTALPLWERSEEAWELMRILQPIEEDKFNLTSRDLDILQALLEHRFLTLNQIVRIHFRSKSGYYTCSRRMRKLFQIGLVLRYRPMVMKNEGSAPYIFSISQLGYEVISKTRFLEQDISSLYYREDGNIIELSRIIHELELNDFCLDFFEEAIAKKLRFEWTPTRLTRQSFSVTGGKTFTVEPDAVFHIYTQKGERVLHIEYERSADRRRFRQKIERWKAYRKQQAWREKYGAEPFILVVGHERSVETNGRKRRVFNSILPLQSIAEFRQFENIAFLTLDERQKGGWNCLPMKNITKTIWDYVVG